MIPNSEYVICSSAETAAALAVEIAEGVRAPLYRNPFACLAIWACQPAPMMVRYVPWRVTWQRSPMGLEILATKRLDREFGR